ncbi:MAG: ribosome silencing factor [Rhodospirillaceae bacterium]|nr:ribosome silencing factor [Rhodospirillaceae bacterium]
MGVIHIVVKNKYPQNVETFLNQIKEVLDQSKGREINIISLDEKYTIADYMIVASGTSKRHLTTMANQLQKEFKSISKRPVAIEGLTNGSWVLIDGGDIIVHLFDVETRSMYDLDNLWASQISPKDSIV